ncbi:hypothetical protein [Pyrobaculum neutrophilum]|uniref:Uncharacterized protein n=1 Tax=Pyrobaculum neutrophilum (strain DSM 2338 / JCM 9278 / NBRC 100436 / V24Sta) TaxID=444157 RepID=B1YAI3_PYRNV|nr:hypothetical protein [Pyrobaculum neutrophilum]ACB40632.1 conserved hypothetical protein [Pyrobaculum neutrophilum V24Sta]
MILTQIFRLAGVVLLVALATVFASSASLIEKRGSVVVENLTALTDVLRPTYVFDLGACSAYVYVARSFNDTTPMLFLSRMERPLPPFPSHSFEELVDAVLPLVGPEVEVEVSIYGVSDAGRGAYQVSKIVKVAARNYTELEVAVGRALGLEVYRDPSKGLNGNGTAQSGRREIAVIDRVVMKTPKVKVLLRRGDPLIIDTISSAEAEGIIKAVKERIGDFSAIVTVGPYWAGGDEENERLRNAAMRLEEEMGTVRKTERGVEGIIHLFTLSSAGPRVFVFPYPNGTRPPDEKTAEKIVRRFVELSGYCKSPLIVEFWPKTGYEFREPRDAPPLWAAAVLAALVPLVAIYLRRRK